MPKDSIAENTIEIPIRDLEHTGALALRAIGVNQADAQIVLPILMYAQLRASTQGLIKIVEKTVLPRANASPITVDQVAPGMLAVNGNGQIGMVVLSHATELLAQRASEQGLAMATTRGTASSTGAIGYYAAKLSEQGLIGIAMAGSPKTMAPYGGVDPVMGTNPIAISMPLPDAASGRSLTFDMASAAIPVFGLIAARHQGQSIEPDLAFDAAGQPTTDPAAALDGAIRAFGGAKGSGLALMLELLTGALTGASLPDDSQDNRGNLILAIDPARFMPVESFAQRVQQTVDAVKSSRREVTGQSVRLPGEASAALAETALRTGRTRISQPLWSGLQQLAATA